MKKIAWIVTHPIQYYSPLYREVSKSKDIDLTVYYFSDFSVQGYKDKEFGKQIKWDIPLLSGYKYNFLKNYSFNKTHGKFFSYIHFGLFKEIKNEAYDLVIVHGWSTMSHLITILSCIITKTPYALRGDTNTHNINEVSNFRNYIRKKILSWIFLKAAVIFYIGEQNKLFYFSFDIDNSKLIKMPLAIDNNFFRSYENTNIVLERKKLGLNSKQLVILFTGKLIKKKQLELLINALAEIESNYVLLVVGDGELYQEMLNMSESLGVNAKFLGFVNQGDIPKYYWLSDIYVMPSSIEPWGLAINEAMNCHCAIIASSNVGATDDLIVDNGFIFSSGNMNELKEKLILLLNDKLLLTSCKDASRKIIDRYSFNEDLKAISAFFEM